MKFLRRTSAGSMPISAAKRSIVRSIACAASGRPAPRIVVIGVVFVTTERAFDLDLRDRVHPARHEPGQIREEGADARVRAGVREDVEPVGEQLPVARAAERELEPLAAAVGEREHALAARLRPADGPARACARARRRAPPRTARILAPKPPPTSGAIDADLTGLEPEHAREAEVVAVRRLRGEPGRQRGRRRRPRRPPSAARAARRPSAGSRSCPETTTSQPSKSSRSCSCGPPRPATFVPTSGKSSTSSFAASTMSTTTGSGS